MFKYNKKRKYDTTLKLIDKNNTVNLRERVKILIVDDDEIGIVDYLKTRNFDVYYKNDLNYIIEAMPFDIIIMDIKGVGKSLGSSMEGFALACEIKKKYPHKQVHCFSSTVKSEIAADLKKIDGFISKDYDVDKWAEQLDGIIAKYVNIDYQWSVLEQQLIKISINKTDIEDIKTVYYDSFNNNKFDNIDTVLMGIIKNTNVMLGVLQTILSLVKILCE